MPAHIQLGDVFTAAGAFATQVLPSKYQPRRTYMAMESRRQKNHHWISPANTFLSPGKTRDKREIVCLTYEEYRKALDLFNAAALKSPVGTVYPWYMKVVDPRVETPMGAAEKDTGIDKPWDKAGFAHFSNEWDLYLQPDTAFDKIVKTRLANGETITLIRRSHERYYQLKRIEAVTHKGTTVLWSIH